MKGEAQRSAVRVHGQAATAAQQTGCCSVGIWRTMVANCCLSVSGCYVELGNAVHWCPLHNAELWGWKCADLPYGGRDLLTNSFKACLLLLRFLDALHASLTSLSRHQEGQS